MKESAWLHYSGERERARKNDNEKEMSKQKKEKETAHSHQPTEMVINDPVACTYTRNERRREKMNLNKNTEEKNTAFLFRSLFHAV